MHGTMTGNVSLLLGQKDQRQCFLDRIRHDERNTLRNTHTRHLLWRQFEHCFNKWCKL